MTAILPAARPAATPQRVAGVGARKPRPWPGARPVGRPNPRFRVPPPLEPRYDDAGVTRRAGANPALPLDAEPRPRPRVTAEAGRGEPTGRWPVDARPWANRFVRAAVEILVGRRPIDQLRRCATARAVAGVHAAVAGWERAAGVDQAGDVVRSVHVGEPVHGVAEVCAVLRQGDHYRALAARLEVLDGRWWCVSFRLL